MTTSIESRLWLAVHLLYPNSAQAFDVYQAIMLQSDTVTSQVNSISVFSKLVSVFHKITAINSNLSFYEFEFDQIDRWKEIYKSSQKIQLVIFIGVLIFELKISEIAPYVKLTSEKALLLFYQTFKKFSKEAASKIKHSEQLNFKKQNDAKISYLYTYENLIEYCLGHLSASEAEKVEKGLELYPSLQAAEAEYLKIISQIQNLKVQRSNSSLVKTWEKNKARDKPKNIMKLVPTGVVGDPLESVTEKTTAKKRVASVAFVFVVVTFMLFQLRDVREYIAGSEKTVVLHQIKKNPGEPASQPSAFGYGTPQAFQPQLLPRQTELARMAETTPQVALQAPLQVAKVASAAQQTEQIKSKGGLYRGVLFVKNLSDDNKKVLARLSELGAKKAGEVSLGWLKSEGMAYYHFTIPEQNIEDVNKFFKEIGQLQIKFEAHPRLIPAGSKRFIIEVKGK